MIRRILLSAMVFGSLGLFGIPSVQAQCGGGGFGGFGYGRGYGRPSYGGYSGGCRGYGGYGYGGGCARLYGGGYDVGPGYGSPGFGGYAGGPAPMAPADPGMPDGAAARQKSLPPAPPPVASDDGMPHVGAPRPAPDNTARGLSPKQQRIAANLVQLAPADRAAAQKQKFCAVLKKNELGSMGVPIKLVLDGKPLFLCCESCLDSALEKWPTAKLAEGPANSESR